MLTLYKLVAHIYDNNLSTDYILIKCCAPLFCMLLMYHCQLPRHPSLIIRMQPHFDGERNAKLLYILMSMLYKYVARIYDNNLSTDYILIKCCAPLLYMLLICQCQLSRQVIIHIHVNVMQVCGAHL